MNAKERCYEWSNNKIANFIFHFTAIFYSRVFASFAFYSSCFFFSSRFILTEHEIYAIASEWENIVLIISCWLFELVSINQHFLQKDLLLFFQFHWFNFTRKKPIKNIVKSSKAKRKKNCRVQENLSKLWKNCNRLPRTKKGYWDAINHKQAPSLSSYFFSLLNGVEIQWNKLP